VTERPPQATEDWDGDTIDRGAPVVRPDVLGDQILTLLQASVHDVHINKGNALQFVEGLLHLASQREQQITQLHGQIQALRNALKVLL